jgi:hypothetical protein
MTSRDRETILEGLRLIAEHGREAAEMIAQAVKAGELDRDAFDEAQAQIEDIQRADTEA